VEYERPVPLIGDATAASQRAADPTGWAFAPNERDALYAIIDARRDVRRFRPDPIPADVLNRVLSAAHAAPSVGHSQPWRFIVVRDPDLRSRAMLLADRERLRQASLMAPDSARRLLDLQLDGIREAPLGVVVCCDRRTPATGVLGRATFADADMWSCATAIQNLWLSARAEGLGLGWVTLFRPDDLAELVDLPDSVETLGWLCLGWPDERPPAPGLARAGWSKKLPLHDVVSEDSWRQETASPASHLRSVSAPDQAAVVAAHDDTDRLLTPPGSLGVLDRAVERVIALGRRDIAGGTLVLAAADHPVAALGVTAFPSSVTAEVLAAARGGTALGVSAATTSGLKTHVVDVGVGPSNRGDLAHTDALTTDEVRRLADDGVALGAELAPDGLVALGEVGIGNTTVAACLAVALTGMSVDEAVGLGAGADSAILDRKHEVVSAALTRWRDAGSPTGDRLMAMLGGPEFAYLAGVAIGAAAAGAPIVLDGLATSVAALYAVGEEPAVAAHLIAGQRSRERAHQLVLTHLGCEPLLDLRIRSGEGAGAAFAAGLLLNALAVRRITARVAY
jgi:nicotinate-nucleotide--dimethylbenzimidazole phosphoribosyltransferase